MPEKARNASTPLQAQMDGGQGKMPPAFALGNTNANGGPVQRQTPDEQKKLADFEAANHGLWMKDLLEKLKAEPRGFVGSLHKYVAAGAGLAGNQGRTLAAIEAVIGYQFSAISEAWLKKAETSNPDQLQEIQAAVGKTFDYTIDEAELGTSKTTSPIAENSQSPQMVVRKELFHETWLYTMSKAVMKWADKKVDTTTGQAQFSFEDMSGDKALGKTLKAETATAVKAQFTKAGEINSMTAEYKTINYDWILRFMVYHGLVTPPAGSETKFSYSKDLGDKGEAFKKSDAAVSALQAGAMKKSKRPDPKNGLFNTTDAPMEWSSDSKQVKGEKAIMEKIKELEVKVNEEKDEKKKAALQAQLAAEQKKLRNLPAYRTFASSVMPLLERLKVLNSTFSVGTYIGHSWGQFSADVFIKTSLKADGFWKESVVNQFFDDLNKAAEMDETATGGAGKFAWRAIYNDTAVAAETNKKYGKGRQLTGIAGHGSDKIHIHLDLRALRFGKDATTGYKTNAQGRVVV